MVAFPKPKTPLAARFACAARFALPAAVAAWALQYLRVMPSGSDMELPGPFRVWWPAVPALAAAGLAGAARAALAWWRLERRGEPDPAPAEPDDPLGWPDLAVFLGVAVLAAGVVARHAHAVNPEGALVGVDAPSYLNNMLVILRSDWQWYNGDKRVLHGALGAGLGWLLGGDIQRAALWISAGSIAALGPLTWLAGRAFLGRLPATLAALAVIGDAQLWPYAVQTTNYALYYGLVAALLCASAWAVARPGGVRVVLVGLAAGLLLSTQEKAPLIVAPCALVAIAAALATRARHTGLALALAAGLGALTVALLDPPGSYTPFGSLIVNQREELHVEMPGWRWETVRQPDPASPCPLSPWLPERLRKSGLEATLAGLTAPPDSDVLRLVRRDPADRGTWAVEPDTSIPPWRYRVAFNAEALSITFGARLPVQLTLLGLGLLAVASPWPRGRGRARMALALCLLLLPSLLGPLSLKYHPRYFLHAAPALALFTVGGLSWLLGLLAGAPRRWPRLLAGGLLVPVGLAWALTLYQGDVTAWRRPREALTLAPLAVAPPDLQLDGFPLALARAARWLESQPATRIHDCGPISVGLLLGGDPRFGPPREEACRDALAQPPAAGDLLVSSDRPEYRGPGTLTRHQIQRARFWAPVRAFDPWNATADLPASPSQDAIVVWGPR